MGIIPGIGVTTHKSYFEDGSDAYEYDDQFYANYDDIPFATKEVYDKVAPAVGSFAKGTWEDMKKDPLTGHLLKGASWALGKGFQYIDRESMGGISGAFQLIDQGMTAAGDAIEYHTGLYSPTAKIGTELAVDYAFSGGLGKTAKTAKVLASKADNFLDDAARFVFPNTADALVPVEGVLNWATKTAIENTDSAFNASFMYASSSARIGLKGKKFTGFTGVDPTSSRIKELVDTQKSLKDAERLRLKKLSDDGILPPPPKGLNAEQIEKYYGMSPKEMTKAHNARYVNKKSTAEPNFQLKSTASEKLEKELRDLRIVDVTNPDFMSTGKRKWGYINKELGMEAHHITPIHVSSKLKQLYLYDQLGIPRPGGLAKWNKRVAKDAKIGIFHGNDPRNIVAVRGSKKIPTTPAGQRSEIYHRQGLLLEENLGYHNIEKSIKWGTNVPDLIDLSPYRDLMSNQTKLRQKAIKVIHDVQGYQRQITSAPK